MPPELKRLLEKIALYKHNIDLSKNKLSAVDSVISHEAFKYLPLQFCHFLVDIAIWQC